MSTTIHGTILHSAVASGAEDVFRVVLSTLKETLTSTQVSRNACAAAPLLDAVAPFGFQESPSFLPPTGSAAPRTSTGLALCRPQASQLLPAYDAHTK